MNLRESVVLEMTRLELMSGRVPFTHHHDYVRLNADEAKFMSRADVAKLDSSEDELYACAFLQAVEGMTTEQKICSDVNKLLFRQCLEIASVHLSDINNLLREERS